jgi:hypothetical protein
VSIEARLAALEADVADLKQQRSTLTRADRDALARILPAVVGVFGSSAFIASDVVHHTALRLVVSGSARRFGKLLKRATGVIVDGFIVERLATEAHAIVWRIVGVPEFLEVSNSTPSPVPRRGRPSSGLEARSR